MDKAMEVLGRCLKLDPTREYTAAELVPVLGLSLGTIYAHLYYGRIAPVRTRVKTCKWLVSATGAAVLEFARARVRKPHRRHYASNVSTD